MIKRIFVVMVFILSASLSYASYSVYSHNLFQGKQLMKRGDFQEARMHFVRAFEAQKLPEALAFAAAASYKMNDVKAAENYITEAEKQQSKGVSELRIAGYKALIYFKEERTSEGMKALQDYITLYRHLDPLMSIQEVETMIRREKIDLGRLELLLDEQVTWREDEIEQFQKTGTGFYGRRGAVW